MSTFEELTMKKQLIVHIGTHKTGSTSLQQFLLDNAGTLSRQGIGLYRGQFKEVNHTELHLAAMRYERDTFQKQGRYKHITIDATFTRQVARRVQAFIDSRREQRLVFTSEGLSWLRHDDEIERLRTILDISSNDVTIVLYLRNKQDFLHSYTNQLLKYGRKPSSDTQSVLYVGLDSWLADYESLIGAYEKGFGPSSVVVIDYDGEMKRVENVIPSFLKVLDIDPADKLDVPSYFLNTTKPADERKPPRGAKRWIQRAKHVWLRWAQRRAA